MKNAFLISVLLAINTMAGCASTGSTAATQPTLATITTQSEASFDAAVNAVYLGVVSGAIPKAEYWKDVDPAVMAGQAAIASMRSHANAGDATGEQVAESAVIAATAQLQPYAIRAQAAQAAKAKPTTKAS